LRFSILIPSYNHGRFVAAAVDSCLRQDYPREDYEIVVVDDGSTDESLAVLEPYAAAGEIILVRQANRGQGAAFAAALAASTGDYLCLLDADDLFAPGKLAAVAAWLDHEKPSGRHLLLCHDLDILDQANARKMPMTWFRFIGTPAEVVRTDLERLIAKPHKHPFSIPTGQILARQTLLQAFSSMDDEDWRRGADAAIGWGATLAAGTVHYLHQPLATYRAHDANGFIAVQSGRLVIKVQPVTRGAKLMRFIERCISDLERNGTDITDARRLQDALKPLLLNTTQQNFPHFVPAPAAVPGTVLPGNPLRTRDDVAALLDSLLAAVATQRSAGGARVNLGETASHYPRAVAEMEGFCRLLWGMVPAGAGGCGAVDWATLRKGLANGVDPTHLEYWGGLTHFDQRAVELAAIAYGLCLVPEHLWEPLPVPARAQLRVYLEQVNHCSLFDNNWLCFRVLVNVALARLGFPIDEAARAADLDRVESFHAGDGWYRDGSDGACDYYAAYVVQFYALLCCVLMPGIDAARVARLRERARLFALQFMHWFAADGGAIPFGRSLHYRFAPAAFWGALAFADIEALPWGVIKGIYLRHLRWWLARPIRDDKGRLGLGHAYANLNLVESYASPASPYWALKAFVPLALPATHPFWNSEEMPLPALPATVTQRSAGMIVARQAVSDHVLLFPAPGGPQPGLRHGAEKYAKFCYSNHFGFSVPSAAVELDAGAHDNMLALSEEGEYFRVRRGSLRIGMVDAAVVSEWAPWPDVLIRTWVVPAGYWHVRVHRVQTARRLVAMEGGFALPHQGAFRVRLRKNADRDVAVADAGSLRSVIVDLLGQRRGVAVPAAPNTNVLHPSTLIPTLQSEMAAGIHWLACAVAGDPCAQEDALPGLPVVSLPGAELRITDHAGGMLFREPV
jgi:glycosyltransferase involved in cell wall biosynthesis